MQPNILELISHDTENNGFTDLVREPELRAEDLNLEDEFLIFMFPYTKQILLGQVLHKPLFLHAL